VASFVASLFLAWLAQSILRGQLLFVTISINPPYPNLLIGIPLILVSGMLFAIALPWTAPAPTIVKVEITHVDRRSLAGIAFALVTAVFAAISVNGNGLSYLGGVALVLGLVALVRAARRLDQQNAITLSDKTNSGRAWQRWEFDALAGLIVLAAVLRLVNLDQVPFGVWYDEGRMGIEAATLFANGNLPVYLPGHPGVVLFYPVSAALALLGPTVVAIRGVAALVGIATIPVLYLFVRSLWGPRVALASAFLLAVSRWHIDFSRAIEWDATFVTLVLCATLYCFYRALRKGQLLDAVLAGVVMGLGLYGYHPGRGIPFVLVGLVVLIVIWLVMSTQRQGKFRVLFNTAIGMLLGLIVIAAPLASYAVNNPNQFNERLGQASVFSTGASSDTALQTLAISTSKHLLMFNAQGDRNGRHNLPGAPMLDDLTGILFLIGLGYCLRYWYKPYAFTLLLVFCAMLLPGILSLAFEAPQGLRSICVLGAVAWIAGIPLGRAASAGGDAFWQWRREMVRIPIAVALVVAALIGYANINSYFVLQPNNPEAWAAASTAETITARYLARIDQSKTEVYLSSQVRPDHPSIRFILQRVAPARFVDNSVCVPVHTDKPEALFLLVPGQADGVWEDLRRVYPQGQYSMEGLPSQSTAPTTPVLRVARLSSNDLLSVHGLDVSYYKSPRGQSEALLKRQVSGFGNELARDLPFSAPVELEARAVLAVPTFGTYQLSLSGAKQGALYIDENKVVEAGQTATLDALAKGFHSLRLVTSVGTGEAAPEVFWQGPNIQKRAVSTNDLYRSPVTVHGLLGRYFANQNWEGQPALAQIDPRIDFYFHVTPLQRPYSVEWSGKLYVPKSGQYEFATEQISTSRLSIDGKQIIDNRTNGAMAQAKVELQAGYHDVKLMFIDQDGYSHLYLYWTPPGGKREIIPSDNLFPPMGAYPQK
jgi:4-amino-4-deoxy-L-arabinose transferase-like glycosyltransferase